MKDSNLQMLIDLSRELINENLNQLQDELRQVKLHMTQEDRDSVFESIEDKLDTISSRIGNMKTLIKPELD